MVDGRLDDDSTEILFQLLPRYLSANELTIGSLLVAEANHII